VTEQQSVSPQPLSRALLVGTYRSGTDRQLCEDYLDELERLADTYGVETAVKIACPIKKIDSATFIGSGKVEELVEIVREQKIDLLIFDEEIHPTQQRNLEAIFKRTVMDRTEIILAVFAHHAHTREARLQIELAQVRYQAPRLKRMWTHLSRQRSGGVYQKGEGEKQIEIDRRLIKRRVEQLEKELEEVRLNRQIQKVARSRQGIPTFAIVGYTNVGKSTLLKALTQADVLVEDKLFATLDTTTRKFKLPNNQDILLIDTVGFIRKIPHTLVAAFKSTLEEAVEADILLHLVDVSHPMALEQAKATHVVLKELGATDRPMITVLNKIDKCENPSLISRLRVMYPKTVQISALNQTGFDDLLEMMVAEISKLRREVKLKIPQSHYAVLSALLQQGRVIYQDYEENDIIIRIEIPAQLVGRVQEFIVP
jgi:GTPase